MDTLTTPEHAMSRIIPCLAAWALLFAAPVALAHTSSQPPHQLFNEGDLKLERGR